MSTALVTGSSSGIGLATAVQLAVDGHRVIGSMRDTTRAGDLQAAASTAGVTIEVTELDVNNDTSVADAFGRLDTIDVLVNNAGMSPIGSVEEFPLSDWKALFETNVFGVIRCTQAALPAMRQQGSGHIVNISSMTGRTAIPMFGAYSSSKWAVEAFTESMASEVAVFGVRATLIEPGAVATPIREKTGAPDRSSPYRPVAKNWGFSVAYDHRHARGPEEVATAISRAVGDPDSPFRITVGMGVDEIIELRSKHTDEEWIELWSADTADFLAMFELKTGTDLTE